MRELEEQERRELEAFYEQHPEWAEEPDFRDRRSVSLDPRTLEALNPVSDLSHRHTTGLSDTDKLRVSPLWGDTEVETLEQGFKASAVYETTAHMRPRDREMLERRFVERMTLDAIAEEEGITRQAVLKRLETARKNFLKEWEHDA